MKLVLALLCLFTLKAQADSKVGVYGSVNWNTSQNDDIDDIAGSREEPAPSFGFGVRGLLQLGEDRLFLRTGAGFQKKIFKFEYTEAPVEGGNSYEFSYITVPLTLYVKAAPNFGVFGGTAIQAKIDDSCHGSVRDNGTTLRCQIEDDNAIVFPAILGFDILINDNFSVELSYEYALMETLKDTKVSTAVGSLVYTF